MKLLQCLATWVLFQVALATNMIMSSALLSCMENSQFTASTFDVVLFPDNKTVNFDITAISTIEGNITAEIEIIAYGITVVSESIDACKIGVDQLCPIEAGHFDVQSSQKLTGAVLDQIPGIAYTIPDLDGVVRVKVYKNDKSGNKQGSAIACVQATLSNGKTVQTKYASWGIGAVVALGLITAGIVSLVGHTSTASHIAANTVSLFVYFQSVAIVAMEAVQRTPPITAAWAQNFMWTMGLMHVKFLQNIFNWYVQATGGKATNLLPNADVISLEVQKRDLSGVVPEFGNYASRYVRNGMSRNLYRSMVNAAHGAASAATSAAQNVIVRRASSSDTTTNELDPDLSAKTLVLRGMERVAYLSDIELSSLFLTGLVFFLIFACLIVIVMSLFKGIVELLAKTGVIHPGRFVDYRRGWRTVMKGVLFRVILVAFPQLSVLCLWELVQRDSAAVVVLAILVYIIVVAILGLAAFKVITIARRSQALHKNPAYILFSDPAALNRFGFLYIQYRATAYYFVVPVLLYIFVKSCFIAFAQQAGKVQAMAVFLIELAFLVAVCWLKPFMDKRTNGFNIAIAAINFVNALFFLFFSKLFGQPDSVSGVMGVVFFVINAVFSLVLLIMMIVSCVWALFSSNPDTRYQPMRDDRESFIRDANAISEKKMATELDALGATARSGYAQNNDSSDFLAPSSSHLNENPFASQRSLNDSFPQAHLPRDRSDTNLAVPHDHRDNDHDSPVRAESPGFPTQYQTTYQGYFPTPTDNFRRY
ncbi:flavin carrier protein 2 [Trichomonascus vanleenenianus]|uniref:transient receptor potential ion channel family protein n=1 Tax=Trichomonascus vanleenenianus TaxID=2268995 RepID=UPI003ECB6F02